MYEGRREDLWTQNLIVGFDTETTGFDPINGRVIQFGLVIYDPVKDVVLDRLYDLCDSDGVPIDPGAQAAHGITAEMIAGKPTFDACLPGIRERITKLGPYTALAYNAPFDLAFFAAASVRLGWGSPLFDARRVLDPLLVARWGRPYGNKLPEVCVRLGVDLDNAHDASADAEAAVRCMMKYQKMGHPSDLDALLAFQDESRVKWDRRTGHRYWDTYDTVCRATGRDWSVPR